MITAYLRNTDNWRTMLRLERNVQERTDDTVSDVADAVVRDIRSSWSPISPSSPKTPPAKDTEALDNGISVEKQGRDELGRFAGKDSPVRYIHFDTSANRNKQYATALERGTKKMEERPYLQPALDRAGGLLVFEFKKANLFRG